jgi:hypothetical protein
MRMGDATAVEAVPPASVQSVTPEMLNQPVDGSEVATGGGGDAETAPVHFSLNTYIRVD